jgi:hypothetical protein
MNETLEMASKSIEIFCEACEWLNDYARNLRSSERFRTVVTSADIRDYRSGWRLEKCIEAELDQKEGLFACWWLELGYQDGHWLVSSNLSISHSDVYFEFPDRFAETVEELKTRLNKAVCELKNSLESHDGFKAAVGALQTLANRQA